MDTYEGPVVVMTVEEAKGYKLDVEETRLEIRELRAAICKVIEWNERREDGRVMPIWLLWGLNRALRGGDDGSGDVTRAVQRARTPEDSDV